MDTFDPFSDKSIESVQRVQPVPNLIEGVAEAVGRSVTYASLGLRIGARIIDLIVLAAVSAISGVIAGVLLTILVLAVGLNVGTLASTPWSSILSFLISVMLTIFYSVAFEGFHGSTPGKMILGITVRGERGDFCTPGQALVRELAFFIDGLFWGIVGIVTINSSPFRQRLGDRWAKTIVVRIDSIDLTQKREPARFFQVIAIWLTIAIFVNAVSLLLLTL